jgi:hypothetical protein
MSDITESWWFRLYGGWDSQVVPGPSSIYYTNPGLCYASLDLEWSMGNKGVINGFFSPKIADEKQLIPRDTNGHTYCKIDGAIPLQTVYVLENEPCFADYVKCQKNSLWIYSDVACNGTVEHFPLNSGVNRIATSGVDWNVTSVLMQGNSQETVYTLHLPGGLFVPDLQRESGKVIVTFFTLSLLFLTLTTLYFLYIALKKRILKYWLFFGTMLMRLMYKICVVYLIFSLFDDYESLAIVQQIFAVLYCSCSLISTLMNSSNVVKFVFHRSSVAATMVYSTVIVIFLGIGSPYLLMYWFYSPKYTFEGILLTLYYDWFIKVESFWTSFTFAFDPFCSFLILVYIINTKLREYPFRDKLMFLFKQKMLLGLIGASWIVFITHLTFRYIRYSTLLLKDDYTNHVLSNFATVLFGINQFLSIMYIESFPVLFKVANEYSDSKKTKFEVPMMKRLVDMSPLEKNPVKTMDTVVLPQ